MIKKVCDRCDEEIVGQNKYVEFQIKFMKGSLCQMCSECFIKWVFSEHEVLINGEN